MKKKHNCDFQLKRGGRKSQVRGENVLALGLLTVHNHLMEVRYKQMLCLERF